MSETQRHGRPRKTGYLASLDGWRAIAILGVMMTHDRAWTIFGHDSSSYMGYGGYGVYLFFAISGFLITTRILEEETVVGRFDIRRFYVRRLFRIQPAALAFLVVIAALLLAGIASGDGVIETWHSWLAALLLVTNYTYHVGDAPTLTGHFWTLAVEEHFYILLSAALLLFKRRRVVVMGALYALGLGLYLSQGWLGKLLCGLRWYPCETPRSTQWQLTTLFLAAFVAVLVRREALLRMVTTLLRPWVAFALTPVLMVLHNGFEQLLGHDGLSPLHGLRFQIGFVALYLPILWIVATVFHPGSVTTRLLETRPLRFIGRISYSLYLWHVLVNYLWHLLLFNYGGPMSHVHAHWLHSLLERPARVATSFLLATASYYWLEKPLIRLGHKLAPPATPGRPELADLPVEHTAGADT
jgi:peptidoglycan/LPS O-acetylase OafA/YrhL